MFPDKCFICSRVRIQVHKKDEYPVVVTLDKVESSIKAAAKVKMPTFYFEVKEMDLIAKELKYHVTCYKTFIIGFTESPRQINETNEM